VTKIINRLLDPIENRLVLGDLETRKANNIIAQFLKWAHSGDISAVDQ